MIPVTIGELAAATGGELLPGTDPAADVTGEVTIDSRRAGPGGLFAALAGEHVDGHEFATAATAAGAAAVLASRPVDAPGVLVRDVTDALSGLARLVLARCTAAVLGVTGSSGKTTTKDLLATIVATQGAVVAPVGSFNNELGLPLTVCRVTPDTRWLVLEYSARGPGHIAHLCGIAQPRIAGVLNVGQAHLGEFGSVEAIARAKGELVEAVPDDGVAVLNSDDPRVAGMAARCHGRVITAGRAAGSDIRLASVRVTAAGTPAFLLRTPEGDVDVRLGLPGEHNAANAAVAAGMALAAGIPLDAVAAALAAARPVSPHRMDLRRLPDGSTVIDDAYNANPESMAAALRALAAVPATRRWAVLGAMRELGAESTDLHRQVGRSAAEAGIDRVLAVGAEAEVIAAGAAETPGWSGVATTLPDAAAAIERLAADLRPGDAVLVKASNSERLWQVAEALLQEDRPAAGVTGGAR